MAGPATAGLFIYAKDLERLSVFYQALLGFGEIHAREDIAVLEVFGLQLVIHAIPRHIADSFEITSPPERREEAALKFFFTVPSLDEAAVIAAAHGGEVLHDRWEGRGFRACNAIDPEGNIFQLRESSAP
ncbi:MAG: VOC family protein [Lysobacterales bacterium]|nr:glyoxalase/bleomycin resistance/dioxygenase family protein [Xanthomonadales bacterium]